MRIGTSLPALLLVLGVAALPVEAWAQAKKEQEKQSLTKDQAVRKYREGVALERAGKYREAMASYAVAGEAGNGLAQKRLAMIYDRGNPVVTRDYQNAIHWYEKARAQGIELPKPLPPIKGR
jgi:TPR repeat protein